MNFDRRLFQLSRLARGELAVSVLAGLAGGLAVIAQAWLLTRILAAVFLNGHSLAEVLPLLALLLGAFGLRALMGYMSETAAQRGAVRIKDHLRRSLAEKVFALGPLYAEGERSGELASVLAQGVDAVEAYYSQFLPQLALAVLVPAAFLAAAFPLDLISGLALLLTGPLVPFFMFLIGSKSEQLTRRQFNRMGQMSAFLLDTIQGITTLKIFGRSLDQAGRIARVSERYREATMAVLRVTFLSALALELLSTLGTAVIAVEVGLRLLYGLMPFEAAFFLLLLAPEFYLPLRSLGLRFHASMSGVQAARRIFAVLEQPATAPPAPEVATALGDVSHGVSVRFERVTFAYARASEPALADVTFEIRAGELLAVVGRSGSGKSTLARLLMQFARPREGAITVNGAALAALAPPDWRALLSWVPQQAFLFNGTLAYNLRLARPGASESDLRRAARLARLEDWIDSQPHGFETKVGEGAARLSGGQAQRLALARAFLRDAPLLIMDEPTAHLDYEHEQLFQEALDRLAGARTVVVIAHRLSTARRADRILVLDRGRLAGDGRHEDLLRSCAAYRALLDAGEGAGA